MIRKNKIMLITLVCIAALLRNVYITSYAVDAYRVSTAGEAIQWLNETQCLIPLYITENKGIMGFRISLEYDSSILQIDSVSKGLVTEAGSFNYGKDSEAAGKIDVIWYSTEDVTIDGTILYIGVTVIDENADNIEIKVSYSVADTFNEAWEDVAFNCDNIVAGTKHNTNSGKIEDIPPDVKAVMSNEDEKEYSFHAAADFNSNLSMNDIGEDIIKDAVVITMTGYNIDSLSKLSGEQEEQFWSDVRETLVQDYGVDIISVNNLNFEKISEQITITNDDVVSIKNHDIASRGDAQKEKELPKNKSLLIVVICFVTVVLLAVIIAVLLCRKRKVRK